MGQDERRMLSVGVQGEVGRNRGEGGGELTCTELERDGEGEQETDGCGMWMLVAR